MASEPEAAGPQREIVKTRSGLWALLPSGALFFLNQLSWKSFESLQLGNMFNLFALRNEEQRVYHQFFALGWLLLMMVLNAKWFWRQVKNFRPLEKMEPPPAAAAVPPVLPK